MSSRSSSRPLLDFLSGGGEMGDLIRAYDWSAHPLGKPENWPQSLKTALSLILNSQHPMWIGWGPEMWFLYNDPYLHDLGLAKHDPGLWENRLPTCGRKSGKTSVRSPKAFSAKAGQASWMKCACL